MNEWSFEAALCRRARARTSASRIERASVRARVGSFARASSLPEVSFDAFDAFDAFARRERGGWERIEGSIDRSNERTHSTSNGPNRERKERFDVDADEPEDAISRTHDAG